MLKKLLKPQKQTIYAQCNKQHLMAMYKEYKFQDPTKAQAKQTQLKNDYGVKIPIFEIESPSGQHWLSIVHPVGLQPKKRR
jgi:hypothetical protein